VPHGFYSGAVIPYDDEADAVPCAPFGGYKSIVTA
jgi:hypothetical protein